MRIRYSVVNPPTEADRAFVGQSLRDRRGWASHGYTFEEVTGNADVHVVFLSDASVVREFGPTFGGLNVCQLTQPGIIAVNRDNWEHPPEVFRAPGTPEERRTTYRHYVLSHEMGHYLGLHRHEPPGPGAPCPVMYQQTKGTGPGICDANPWPAVAPVDPEAFRSHPPAEGVPDLVRAMADRDTPLAGGGDPKVILGPRVLALLSLLFPGDLDGALERVQEAHRHSDDALAATAARLGYRPPPRPRSRTRVIDIPVLGPHGLTNMARAQGDLVMRLLRDRYEQMCGGTTLYDDSLRELCLGASN